MVDAYETGIYPLTIIQKLQAVQGASQPNLPAKQRIPLKLRETYAEEKVLHSDTSKYTLTDARPYSVPDIRPYAKCETFPERSNTELKEFSEPSRSNFIVSFLCRSCCCRCTIM